MGLKATQPYPSSDGVTKDARALRVVSPAYAGREGELTATLQYVYQSILLGGSDDVETARLLMDIATTEMHHVEILGSLITRLGAPPLFTACPPYPVGFYSASCVNYAKTRQTMLSADIAGEKRAIAQYEGMLGELKGEVHAIIARLLADEKVHLSALTKALKS